MTAKTLEQRKSEASQACFYNDGETLYRVLYTTEDKATEIAKLDPIDAEIYGDDDEEPESFTILDEDTGEEYVILYSEVPIEAKFFKLVEID